MKNRTGNKILSLVLAVLLVFTLLPVPIMAEPEAVETGNKVITAFDALAVETATQAVPAGTAPETLNLPDILGATIDGEPGTADNVTWQPQPKYDADTAGIYTFTAVLPNQYNIDDGLSTPVISVMVTADKEAETDPAGIDSMPDIDEDVTDHTDITTPPITYDLQPPVNEEVPAATDSYNNAYQAAQVYAAPAATLVPGSLTAGSYTIEQSGADIILRTEDGTDSCVLNSATQIFVFSGDLTLTVNADVTIQSIFLNNGNLIINGEKTLTVNNNSGRGIYTQGGIEVNGNLTGNGSYLYHGVFSNGSITVGDSGTLVGITDGDTEAVYAGAGLIVHGKLTVTGHIGTSLNIMISSTGTLNGSGYVLAASPTEGNIEIAGALKTDLFVQSGKDMTISGTVESGGGVWAGGNMTVSGTVNNTGSNVAAGGNITVTGILTSNTSPDSGIMLDGDFNINGGSVTVNENTYNGIYVPNGSITITDGSLTANGNGYPGIWVYGNLNINTDGILTANENNSSGVVLQSSLYINSGSFTANDNLYNGAYLPNGDITVENGGTLTADRNGAGNDSPGIWVATGIAVTGGRLTANDNLGNGVYVPYGYIFIEEAGTLSAENNVYPSVCVGTGAYAGGITVTNGELTGICDDDYGVLVRGYIVVEDGSKLTGISKYTRGVWTAGDITVSGELTGSGGVYGVRADGNITVNDSGILTGESTYTGVSSWYGNIEVGGTLISKGDGILANSGSVDADYDISVSGELISSGRVAAFNNIDIKAGATLTGSYGVSANEDLTVAGTLDNTGDWVYAGRNITVTGVLTSHNSSCEGIVAKEDFYIDGGMVTATENTDYGVWVTFGNILVTNGGTLTAQNNGETGVWLRDGSITVTNGKLTGTGNIYGIYAYGSITADGTEAVIKGIAKTRGDSGGSTASVYSTNDKISAANGGMIEEEYTDTPVDFDDTAPQNPYADGFNIADIANYTWTPDLEVSGIGLLAMRNYTDAQTVTGTRKGNAANETVLLDADSLHKISFTGTLSTTEYTITYKANGGKGNDIVLTYHAGDTVTVASNSFIREGYSFTEWSTGESDGTSYYEGETFIMPSDNMTLYAHWELNEYTVTFDTNGGTAIDSQTVNHGDTAKKPENPTKADCIFDGWYTDNETFADEWNFDDPITKDLSLYAKWFISDIQYEFTAGFGIFTGSGSLTGTVNAPCEKFVRLKVDDTEPDSGSYTVTSGSTVITLSEAYLKTLANGTHTVTAEFTDGTAETTLAVKVADIVSVTGVALDKSSAEITTGKTLLLKATVSPSDAANKNVTWSSSDTAIATVDAKGLVTGIKAGKVNITVTTEDGGYTAVCKVTVTAASRGKAVSSSGKTPSAKTGDSSNFWLWLVLLIASFGMLVFKGYRRYRTISER